MKFDLQKQRWAGFGPWAMVSWPLVKWLFGKQGWNSLGFCGWWRKELSTWHKTSQLRFSIYDGEDVFEFFSPRNFSVDITTTTTKIIKASLGEKWPLVPPPTLNTTNCIFIFEHFFFLSPDLLIGVLLQSPGVCTYQILVHWDWVQPKGYKLDLADKVFLRTSSCEALPFSVFSTFSAKEL